MSAECLIIRKFSAPVAYADAWQAMQNFTAARQATTRDEFWLLEHMPVFTQGQNGKTEHVLQPGDIPVLKTDRGGQVTYHGPGQLMLYTLVDVQRKRLNVRELVTALEQAVVAMLADLSITATTQCAAPGVYVAQEKICSIGLRIRRGCAYHGLALNVAMDLSPFQRINPCGFATLTMTHIQALVPTFDMNYLRQQLIGHLVTNLRYTSYEFSAEALYGL